MLRVDTGGNAIERIVVQVTAKDKLVIVEKARQLNMTVSELMRKGAAQYASIDEALVELVKAAQASAERSMARIDETTRFAADSNARIAAMEATAKTVREGLRAQMATARVAD